MATPDPAQVLGRITLVTGPEEFLAERAVREVRAAVRRADPEAEMSETAADQLTMATLGELAAPSLFSATRCVVVRGLEDLPEESAPGLLDYAGRPADDVALVLVHGGGQKGTGLL
ncbi:MAG TPA: DNA polymerase III subunit delta, partial [Marmoricola sp.]